MIKTSLLTKNFQSYKKAPGISGSIKSLFKREYLTKTAVDQFTLEVTKGEIIGLLGPNGAGKTTLMKMFTGIIVPSSGEISIAGHVPSQREKSFRKKIALVMGQKSQLWWDIPAMDSFHLLQKFYEIDKKAFENRLEEMGQLLGVMDLLHIHVRKLSLGERMKLELMASLLHSPEVIFLDEPTIGLDLIAQENIRKFIFEYHKKNNISIILTSHYMADVHALCKRLILIHGGQKAFDGKLSTFEQILGKDKSVSFSFRNEVNDHRVFEQFNPTWSENKTQVDLLIPESELRNFSAQVLRDFPVIDFSTDKMPIEKVMKTLMKNPQILNENL
ncbi:MAG: ATP-binding cassette domain-containing protein [Bacteriovoracaceae bacterium]|jgi:ABC-2 type transport system ATP-binding protein|nr:ATP-binding cassette domain-containing protein [Bacteriovoracaceae bacterium]